MKHAWSLSWVGIPLAAVAVLGWREFAAPVAGEQAAPAAGPTSPAGLPEPLSTAPLALAFGFVAGGQASASLADVVLRACFVSSRGDSRALVGSPDGDAVYRVGDRLPGGSVLRRIEARAITLGLNGREQRVPLAGTSPSLFQLSGSATASRPDAATSPRLLREVQ